MKGVLFWPWYTSRFCFIWYIYDEYCGKIKVFQKQEIDATIKFNPGSCRAHAHKNADDPG